MISRREMMNDKIVEENGNPLLLKKCKGSRFTSLTLHGKSSQGSTKGANMIDANNIYKDTLTSNGVTITKKSDNVYVFNGTPNASYILSRKVNIPLENGKRYKTYTLGIEKFRNDYVVQGYETKEDADAGTNKINTIYMADSAVQIPNDGKIYRLSVCRISRLGGNATYTFKNNVGHIGCYEYQNEDCPFEPYTGGAPSPSPSYPQEIENAGQSGEIGVTVTGTNLLPFEVGQKDAEFEVFEDGIAISTTSNNDIYAIGGMPVNSESAYDEFPLLAPGKYYVYSDDAHVFLYIVAWRKGANVTLGYSSGGVAKEIEVMAGDKFRIFLRTAAAFKGKVKAMITRIPVDATSYEPYKPAQKLIIPTPGGLPGIPVSSGGNYTDKDGQQWVADEIDLAKGERVQWVKTVVFDGSEKWEAQSGANHFSCKKQVDAKNDAPLHGLSPNIRVVNYAVIDSTQEQNVIAYIYFWRLRLADIDMQNGATVDDLKAFLSKNPITVYYASDVPIRTPLPPETIAAYKSLKTYSPTTTVINDAGAGMIVGYRKVRG